MKIENFLDLPMTVPYLGKEIASPIESGYLPRNDDCIDYQGEGWDIGAGVTNVPPFSLHLLNGVIAKEEE
jgi:hypothetical protein